MEGGRETFSLLCLLCLFSWSLWPVQLPGTRDIFNPLLGAGEDNWNSRYHEHPQAQEALAPQPGSSGPLWSQGAPHFSEAWGAVLLTIYIAFYSEEKEKGRWRVVRGRKEL